MKICQFCSTNFEGNYFISLARGLAAEQARLLFVTLQTSQPPAWRQQLPEVAHLSLEADARWQYPLAVLKLARLLKREKVTILHTHLIDAGVAGILAARLARVPLTVVTRHHLDEPLLLGGQLNVEIDRWMARQADCVIVPAEAVRRHMVAQESLSDRNIEVVPHGYELNLLDAAPGDRNRVRREFNLESDFVLGCVGRFFKNKGHYYLLKALKEIACEVPNARLLLLGDGDRALIEAGVREFGLEDRVIFTGYRRDVSACISAMDVLVHPSLSECLPQVLIEAMNVGTPVVATDVGGVPEIITDGETGLLVQAKDADAIAAAVLALYRDEPWRRQLAQAGQRSAQTRFTAAKMVGRHLEIYRRYLTQKGRTLKGEGKYVGAEI
jgi:glycosyltransferase involved in cell wall biosynthesis